MEQRRRFLQSLPWTAFGAIGVASGSLETPSVDHGHIGVYDPRKQRSIPDVPGIDHNGQAFRFYGDLVKDKVVAINFMSIRGEAADPVTAKMAQIAHRLGDKLGNEVFIVSVTQDPEHDTPKKLAAFAQKHRIPKGWLLANCSADGLTALRSRIYHQHHHAMANRTASPESSAPPAKVMSVFYGNGALGLWSNFAIDLPPDEAVRHISWVMPGRKPDGTSRRAGPRRLKSPGLSSDNRVSEIG